MHQEQEKEESGCEEFDCAEKKVEDATLCVFNVK
jgi:hypothetical protein